MSSAALALSVVALVMSSTGVGAARSPRAASATQVVRVAPGKPIAASLLPKIPVRLLPRIPARDLPTVAHARQADKLGGKGEGQLVSACPSATVDLGTWCLDQAPDALTPAQTGQNNYFFATRTCEGRGGYLPTAGQLIGAANKVPLESVIGDSPTKATVDMDPTDGLKDAREMSATLVTTAAGSDAAGSEGVSKAATGNPKLGEPDPAPQPAVPQPQTLQYVTVYDNFQKGGFAGSEPVASPENFRCAFDKVSTAAMTRPTDTNLPSSARAPR